VSWGIVIGGEELHNNHHTYPTSAKLSVRCHEFDLGWVYIRGFEKLGLATLCAGSGGSCDSARPAADATMLNAIIANRYELMANYARRLRRAALAELVAMREQLRQLFTHTGASGEQLVADLQAWLKSAETR